MQPPAPEIHHRPGPLRPRWRALLAALLLLPACAAPGGGRPAAPPRPVPDSAGPAPIAQQEPGVRYDVGGGQWGERVPIDLQVMPAVWMEIEADDPVTGQSTGSATGVGFGARVGWGNRDQSIGILYQGFAVDADNTDVGLHTLYLDFDVRIPIEEGGGTLFFTAGAGLGASWIDFDSGAAETDTEGAAQLRVGLNVEPSPTFALSFGLGGVVLGHPGSTEAYGTYLILGASLTF